MKVSSKVSRNQANLAALGIFVLCAQFGSTAIRQAHAEASKPTEKKQTVTKKTGAKSHSRATLVPPPPPTMPDMGGEMMVPGAFSMGTGAFLDYMSLDDLKLKYEGLKKELDSLELDLADSKLLLSRKEKDCTNFDELFQEGVVSKRELEATHREAERLKRDVEREERKVEEARRVVERVQSRIKTLEAKKKAKPRKK
ncbi:hypothetical protein GC174_12905 [bacterium]|nr:hypothetical protein [bacterium]